MNRATWMNTEKTKKLLEILFFKTDFSSMLMKQFQVAVKLESVKARHPQLLYESKLYKILQVGFIHKDTEVILFFLSNVCFYCSSCCWSRTVCCIMFLPGRSRHTTHTLVRAREGLQCARHGPPWPQP